MTETEKKELTELCAEADQMVSSIIERPAEFEASHLVAALYIARRVSAVAGEMYGLRQELHDLRKIMEKMEFRL